MKQLPHKTVLKTPNKKRYRKVLPFKVPHNYRTSILTKIQSNIKKITNFQSYQGDPYCSCH